MNLTDLRTSLLTGLLGLVLIFCIPAETAFADISWPESSGIQADGGILIDADSDAVLYEKNADQPYYPASITKILTALIIIENCDLEDMVTFSDNAVNNVEAGSSNMGTMVGDVLSVRDCLYGLMLASANESANALAEHCSGSVEAFVEKMNQKARELGCTNSNFANPSGLNNENHYTTARDMAKIMKAAISNQTFLEIDGARYWKHAPIKRYPDPDDPHNTVYAHHGMLKKNDARYYDGAFAGKTGYTSLAGNTLVTSAQKNGITLIAVILNGHQTHYQDTKKLFDFGFRNFKSIRVADYDHSYTSIKNDMTIAGLSTSPISALSIDEDCCITLPQSADFNDVETTLDYSADPLAPSDAIAKISYTYGGHSVGFAYLNIQPTQLMARDIDTELPDLAARDAVTIPEPTTRALEPEPSGAFADAETGSAIPTTNSLPLHPSSLEHESGEPAPIKIPSSLWAALAVTILLATILTAVFLVRAYRERKEENRRYRFEQRRKQRLNDIGFSEQDFDLVIRRNRQSSRHRNRHFGP